MNSVVEAQHPECLEPNLSDVTPAPIRRRWTVEEYHQMGDMGLFDNNQRVQLIEGDIIQMPPIGSRHAGKVGRLTWVLHQHLHHFGKAIVWPQNPVVLDTHNEPEPDIAVLRWRDDFYETNHPRPNDVLLMIEVSDSTVRFDRRVKAPLYARHGIPEYWLVDIPARKLEIYLEPVEGQYRQIVEHQTGLVSPVGLPEVVIDLAALFPAGQSVPTPPSAPSP